MYPRLLFIRSTRLRHLNPTALHDEAYRKWPHHKLIKCFPLTGGLLEFAKCVTLSQNLGIVGYQTLATSIVERHRLVVIEYQWFNSTTFQFVSWLQSERCHCPTDWRRAIRVWTFIRGALHGVASVSLRVRYWPRFWVCDEEDLATRCPKMLPPNSGINYLLHSTVDSMDFPDLLQLAIKGWIWAGLIQIGWSV